MENLDFTFPSEEEMKEAVLMTALIDPMATIQTLLEMLIMTNEFVKLKGLETECVKYLHNKTEQKYQS